MSHIFFKRGSMKKSFAQKIGSFLANIQAIFDNLFIIIFKMLKKVSQESPKKKATKKDSPKSTSQTAIHYAKNTAQFFGEVGESFYTEYEEIKRKKTKNK
ncbi:hypothetical protein COB57_00940 [Candidatus Peregrinibacteria bacterium]|nr:MAG: hypothetical protein COB57_00940 [Candidatus Peregrinibacteria bacterium]